MSKGWKVGRPSTLALRKETAQNKQHYHRLSVVRATSSAFTVNPIIMWAVIQTQVNIYCTSFEGGRMICSKLSLALLPKLVNSIRVLKTSTDVGREGRMLLWTPITALLACACSSCACCPRHDEIGLTAEASPVATCFPPPLLH